MEIYQNEYRIIKVDLATDISDYDEIKFTVKENKTDLDEAAILSLSYLSGDIGIYDASSGLISITIDTIDLGINTGTYYYDIQGTDISEEDVLTITDGTFTVKEQVTRTAITRPSGISGNVTINGGYGNVGGNIRISFVGTYHTFRMWLNEGETTYFQPLPPDTYDLACVSTNYTPDTLDNVTVTADTINTGNDFTLETTLAGVTGTVTLDSTGNVQDVLVKVKDGSTILDTVSPDENGDYEVWVAAGTYDIVFELNAYETGTLSDIVFTAGSGNVNSGNDIELSAEVVEWIKCSGASGTYGSGTGFLTFSQTPGDVTQIFKQLKWSQSSFVAYFQEMKLTLASGVPTVLVELLRLSGGNNLQTEVFNHTFDITLANDTEYRFFITVSWLSGLSNWAIHCTIKDDCNNDLIEETQIYNFNVDISWDNTINAGWWGRVLSSNGDIYVGLQSIVCGFSLHSWRLENIVGDTIPDIWTSPNPVDLILSDDMTKIT